MKIVTAAKSRPKSQARVREDNGRSAIFCTIDFTQTISNPNGQTEARSDDIIGLSFVTRRFPWAGIFT
jgi:hypothetical protein